MIGIHRTRQTLARAILPFALILTACSEADEARDRGLDNLTLGRINDVLNITQCAFNGKEAAPASISEARSIRGWLADETMHQACDLGTTPEQVPVQSGSKPEAPGDVSYEPLSSTKIRICGNFRRPSNERGCQGICVGDRQPYAEFYQARPRAGIFCYDLHLLKGLRPDVGMPTEFIQ
jgi:hypothetical protein